MDNQVGEADRPHLIPSPFSNEDPISLSIVAQVMKSFIHREEDLETRSIDGKHDGYFHGIDLRCPKDRHWYQSSMEITSAHLLRLYGVYSVENGLYLVSENYKCTLDDVLSDGTEEIIDQHGNVQRLNGFFQRILRQIIRGMQDLHDKGSRVSANFKKICIFPESGGYRVKFKRPKMPKLYPNLTSVSWDESHYREDYVKLSGSIVKVLVRRGIKSRDLIDVSGMLYFMQSKFFLRFHFKNMHFHPALLDAKDRCLMRIFSHFEVAVSDSVQFPKGYFVWVRHVPPSLLGVLYHPNSPPCPGETKTHKYIDRIESFARFCRNACAHEEKMTFEDLDQILNDIYPGFFPQWFSIISSAALKLSWCPD